MSDKRGSQVSHGQEAGTAQQQQPCAPQPGGLSTGGCPTTETPQPVSEAKGNGHKADETTQEQQKQQQQGADEDDDSEDSDVSEMYEDEEFEDEDEEDEEELSNGKGYINNYSFLKKPI